jgi:ATP-dependent HslUV protease ATP-binding subunit HslU
MLERLLEKISFEASDRSGESVRVDQAYVNQHLDELVENEDYARYIL